MKVTVYSTTNCGVCHQVMEWLKSNDVPFTNKVIDQSEAAMSDFMEVNDGYVTTPLTVVEPENDEVSKIQGFNLKELRALAHP